MDASKRPPCNTNAGHMYCSDTTTRNAAACNATEDEDNADAMGVHEENDSNDGAGSMNARVKDGIEKIVSNAYMSERDSSGLGMCGLDVGNRENEGKNVNGVRPIVPEMCSLCTLPSVLSVDGQHALLTLTPNFMATASYP